MPLKVHMVTATATGGAGRAAIRLRDALEAVNARTHLWVQRHPDETMSQLRGHLLLGRPWWLLPSVSRLLTQLDGEAGNIRSVNCLPSGRLSELNNTSSDIINLHWLGSDTLSISEIGGLKKPFVWTLHDMWAFCGTEHIADFGQNAPWRLGNTAYGENRLSLDRMVWKQKKKHFPARGWAVCPSEWLADCARDSALLHQWHIKTIPNPLNTEVYAPRDKKKCRIKLGLSPDEQVVLFGAQSADNDKNKGFDLVQRMMHELSLLSSSKPTRCLIFGNQKPGPARFGTLPATYLGRLGTDEALVSAYGAADAVVVPSRQENLPQVATEAQSCGRPVVAFNTSGLKDAVEDERTGILIPPFDVALGARRIRTLLDDPKRLTKMGRNARSRAQRYWCPEVIAREYKAYFEAAIADHSTGNSK